MAHTHGNSKEVRARAQAGAGVIGMVRVRGMVIRGDMIRDGEGEGKLKRHT